MSQHVPGRWDWEQEPRHYRGDPQQPNIGAPASSDSTAWNYPQPVPAPGPLQPQPGTPQWSPAPAPPPWGHLPAAAAPAAYSGAYLPAAPVPPAPLGPGQHWSVLPGALDSIPAPSAADLTSEHLLRPHRPPPTGGWRKMIYLASGNIINPGESAKAVKQQNVYERIRYPQLLSTYKIATLSLKGGVGKTTITAALGGTLAAVRGDRAVAVDANPDRGTLNLKVPQQTAATIRHMLRDGGSINTYADMRNYTSQGSSRLEVLASDTDPAVTEAFSADEYTRAVHILEKFYSIILTDCGTGLLHSAMSAVLEQADCLILVSSGSVDGARSASATLDWLDAHGHRQLVRQAVTVINAPRPSAGKVDMQKVIDHFARRCRGVRLVPFDDHLESGTEIELARLAPQTQTAFLELAAVIAEDFSEKPRPLMQLHPQSPRQR